MLRGARLEVVREIFKGFLVLRLLALIPLLIVIVVLLGVSALTGGLEVLGIAILAAVPAVVVAASGGWWRGASVSDVA